MSPSLPGDIRAADWRTSDKRPVVGGSAHPMGFERSAQYPSLSGTVSERLSGTAAPVDCSDHRSIIERLGGGVEWDGDSCTTSGPSGGAGAAFGGNAGL